MNDRVEIPYLLDRGQEYLQNMQLVRQATEGKKLRDFDADLFDSLSGVRHELVQPLSRITGYFPIWADIINEPSLKAAQQKIVRLLDFFYPQKPESQALMLHQGEDQRVNGAILDLFIGAAGVADSERETVLNQLARMSRRQRTGWVMDCLLAAVKEGEDIINKQTAKKQLVHLESVEKSIREVKETSGFIKAELTGEDYQKKREEVNLQRLWKEATVELDKGANLLIGKKWDRLQEADQLKAVTDPGLVRIIIENLFRNTVRYSDTWINVHGRVVEEKGKKKLHILVANDGSPIDRQEQISVFNKVVRGSNTGRKPGSGMGLYLAHKETQLLGGEIKLESHRTTEGKGLTRFVVDIPLS